MKWKREEEILVIGRISFTLGGTYQREIEISEQQGEGVSLKFAVNRKPVNNGILRRGSHHDCVSGYVRACRRVRKLECEWLNDFPHVCVQKPAEVTAATSIFPSSFWTLIPFPFLLAFIIVSSSSPTRRFSSLVSAHSLLFTLCYLCLRPSGGFLRGTHAQNHFLSLLQAAGICRQLLAFFRQMPFLLSKHTLFKTSSPCLFVHERTFCCCWWSNVLNGSICSPSDITRLVGWWNGLFHCCRSWSHPVKGYFGLHRAVTEGWCIGG